MKYAMFTSSGMFYILRERVPQMENPNRIIIVTGGTGALGTAVAEAFVKKGYPVIVPYIYDREIERFEKQIGDLKAQVTLTNARAIALLAQTNDRWALAGDQLYIDLNARIRISQS